MIEAICWVLIHSLWQGILLALSGGAVILCTRRLAAAVRYRLLCGLLFFFVAGVVLTFFYEWGLMAGGGKGNEESAIIGVSMNWLAGLCAAHAGKIVAVWMLVAVLKSLRLAAGWGYMRTIRRDGMAATALWVERVGSLSRRLGIRRTVKLVESGLVKVPMVMGQLRPIIFIPLGLINHLPAGEMEAVVLHELAHIRRHDELVNIAQQIVECLLFFNPGLLWVSALIREERENCCDDVAIGETRDTVEFVRALVRFKEHSLRQMGLAFPGNKRQLLHRVLRLSRQENKGLNWREGIVLIAGGLLLLSLVWVKSAGVVVRPVEAVAPQVKVASAPKEMVAVLQARQKVSENMEWVEAQLAEIHKKQEGKRDVVRAGKLRNGTGRAVGKITGDEEVALLKERELQLEQSERNLEQVMQNDEQVRKNEEQVRKNEEQVRKNDEQVRNNEEQVRENEGQVKENKKQVNRNKGQAGQNDREPIREEERDRRNREQAEQDRQQGDREREQHEQDVKQHEQDAKQHERDVKQNELDRQQAERDRQQADRDRQQAERDLEQAKRDREQADRDRAQADRDREGANSEKVKEDLARKQADMDRSKTDEVRAKAKEVRVKAEQDRQQAARDSQGTAQH